MGSVDIIADDFQGVIGLNRTAHIHVTGMKQGPSTVIPLNRTDVSGELGLDILLHLSDEVVEQDIFSRDGGVRFELEHPMPVFVLGFFQRFPSGINDRFNGLQMIIFGIVECVQHRSKCSVTWDVSGILTK